MPDGHPHQLNLTRAPGKPDSTTPQAGAARTNSLHGDFSGSNVRPHTVTVALDKGPPQHLDFENNTVAFNAPSDAHIVSVTLYFA